MTERELIELGFTRVDVEAEEGIYPFDWYHYEYSFSTDYDVLELSAYCSDEDLYSRTGEENDWYVELMAIDGRSQITDISDVKVLMDLISKVINILNKNK